MTSPLATAGLRWLVESVVSVSLLLGAAWLAHVALRRAGSAWRHLVWATTLAGALAVPVVSALGPRLAPPAPAPAWLDEPAHAAPAREESPSAVPANPEVRAETAPPAPAPRAESGAAASAPPPAPAADEPEPRRDTAAGLSLAGRALAVWFAGALAVIAPLALARLALRRMSRRATRVRESAWLLQAEEAAREVGLDRPFVLLESDAVEIPMTWGVLSPRVVLPGSAAAWSDDRRRAVLLHELAHVKRHDCLSQLLAQAACAVYWFHPGVWLAARQLRVERERACDDLVLLARTRATDYADHLLDVVRSLGRPGPSPLGAVAFARPSQFEGRLLAVLDPRRRRPALRGAHAWRVGAVALAAAASLATLRPWSIRPAQAGDDDGGRRSVRVQGAVGREAGAREPSEVLVAPSGLPGLERRWQWAMDEAARRGLEGPVWVGYALDGRAEPDRGYATDTEGLDWSTLDENGTRLALRSVLQRAGAAEGPDDVAMLLRLPRPGASPAGAGRLRMQNVTFGAELERRPLLWLGRVDDAEAARWLMHVEPRLGSTELRRAAVDMLALHRAPELVVPLLERTAREGGSTELRLAAVEGLASFPTEASQALLVSLARTDPSSAVRREAVEALGQMDRASAADELLAIARDSRTPTDVRRQAIEAMQRHLDGAEDGGRGPVSPKAPKHKHKSKHAAHPAPEDPGADWSDEDAADAGDVLAEPDGRGPVYLDGHEIDLQRHAVESLGRFPEEVAMPRLRAVLEGNAHPEVRSEVIEVLGRMRSPAARRIVQEAVWQGGHPDVMRQAVEVLGRDGDAMAPALLDIARKHPHRDVRRQAAESLGRCSEPVARPALSRLIREAEDGDVQRQAVESLGRLDGPETVRALRDLVRSHPNPDVRRQALESLGRMDPAVAIPVLEELLQGRRSRP